MKDIELITIIHAKDYDELDATERRLVEHAQAALKGSYAPYSNFKVGAAILLDNGEMWHFRPAHAPGGRPLSMRGQISRTRTST